jgi:glycerophosphoryl diester phosphodiesterase
MKPYAWRLLPLAAIASIAVLAADGPYLIAHRGGIVDDRHPENSPGAIQAAINRGYWMVELDIRQSKDGVPVVQHDPTFQRYYGDPRPAGEMTWEEIGALRADPGGASPMTFEQAAALCAGKIHIMLDVKGETHPLSFYESIEQSLRRHGLLETTYVLGSASSKQHLQGKAVLCANEKELRAAADRREPIASRYVLFELGSNLDAETIRWASERGIPVVAAINTFRYEMAKQDHWKGAQADIQNLLGMGVRHFQIDSIYDRWLLTKH